MKDAIISLRNQSKLKLDEGALTNTEENWPEGHAQQATLRNRPEGGERASQPAQRHLQPQAAGRLLLPWEFACSTSSGLYTLKGKEKNFLNYGKILIAEVEFSMVGINSWLLSAKTQNEKLQFW